MRRRRMRARRFRANAMGSSPSRQLRNISASLRVAKRCVNRITRLLNIMSNRALSLHDFSTVAIIQSPLKRSARSSVPRDEFVMDTYVHHPLKPVCKKDMRVRRCACIRIALNGFGGGTTSSNSKGNGAFIEKRRCRFYSFSSCR